MWNTLRTRLTIILIGLAIGPLLLAGTVLAQRSFALEQERAFDLQGQVAQNVATEVEAYFQGVTNDLNTKRLLSLEMKGHPLSERSKSKAFAK